MKQNKIAAAAAAAQIIRMKRSHFLSLLILAIALGVQAQTEPEKTPPTGKSPAAFKKKETNPPPMSADDKHASTGLKPAVEASLKPIDLGNMDPSVRPEDDFYLYANGGWMKNNPIPPEFGRWTSFDDVSEKNNDALREIAEKGATLAAKAAGKSKVEKAPSVELQKVGDFYASGMDEKAVEAARAKPLEAEFSRIDAIKDREDVLKEIGHLHAMEVSAFFRFTSHQDDKNSTMVIAQAFQGGLGLPDRDYYIKDDEASKKLRDQYVAHITKMMTLLGEPAEAAAADARAVLALETSMAKPARGNMDLRDPQKNYNKMKQANLQALTPDWNWTDYFREIQLAEPGEINVGQPDYFKAADQIFTTVSIHDWKAYLRWCLIHNFASALSRDFVDQDFSFFSKTLSGTLQIAPRWKRVVRTTNYVLGEALGKLYVAEHFPPEAKADALGMVNNLKQALADRIRTLDWMDEPTKQEALKKLAVLKVKIGYPDKWRDYSLLRIDRGPFVLNLERAYTFETARQLKKIGKPVDRSEWDVTPPTADAYANPNLNEVVFPAGILQRPFFDPNADDAVNYGRIGAFIGHEITHHFDDQGRQYDAAGNLRDWWSPASARAYTERSKAIVAQYSAYEPLPGLHINGELTQGENIADIGGVKIAYLALQKALAKKGRPEKIDGFTPEQRFFLAFAQMWRNNQRVEDLKLRLNTDPHSPMRFRAIGPLSNMPEFAVAFELPANCTMIRPADQRVNIW